MNSLLRTRRGQIKGRLGEIRNGRELGYRACTARFIWHACIDCGKERWVILKGGNPGHTQCRSCIHRGQLGELCQNWKGGRRYNSSGYVLVYLYPDDFFFKMADVKHYISEHRLVMAKHLNRCLLPWEIVHHKNGTKTDNRLENLVLLPSRRYHLPDTLIKVRIKRLEAKVEEQAKLIRLLQWQIKGERIYEKFIEKAEDKQ